MTFAGGVASIILALAATEAVGWAVVRLFSDGLTRLEKAAWSFAGGLLTQCAIFLGYLLAGSAAGMGKILLVDALIVGTSLAFSRPRRVTVPCRGREGGARAVLVLLAVVAASAWSLFLVQALSEPMWATDYLAIWGLKGKIIFQASALPRRLFADPALFWAHREYPLLVPVSLALFAALVGAWSDQVLALLWPACELATLLALAGFLGRRVSRFAGAGAAALAALCFPLYQAVNVGTAEVPCALAFVLVGCALLDFLEGASTARLARLAAASLFCVSIKQEGSVFVLFSAALLFVRLRRHPDRSWRGGVAALLAPLVAHSGLLRILSGPQARRDFDFTLFLPHRWPELPALFATVIGRLVGTEARLALIPLLAIAGYLLVTRRGIGDSLLPVFAAQIACYALAFSLSAFGPIYAIDSAFRRLALTLFPAFALVLGARIGPTGEAIPPADERPMLRARQTSRPGRSDPHRNAAPR